MSKLLSRMIFVLSIGLLAACAASINARALPPGIPDEVLKDLNKSLYLQQILADELPALSDEPVKIAVQNPSNAKIVLESPAETVKVFQKNTQTNEWMPLDAEVAYDSDWAYEGCNWDGSLFELSKDCDAVFSIKAKPVGDEETYELAIWVLGYRKDGNDASRLTASTIEVFMHQTAPIPEMGCVPHPIQVEGLPSVLLRVWPSPGEKVPLGCYQRGLRGEEALDGIGIGVEFKALEVYEPEAFLPESSTLDLQSRLELYVDGKISRANQQWSYHELVPSLNLSREEFWASCSYLQYLPVGNHEVHVRFKAFTGEVTGYTWQFEVVK